MPSTMSKFVVEYQRILERTKDEGFIPPVLGSLQSQPVYAKTNDTARDMAHSLAAAIEGCPFEDIMIKSCTLVSENPPAELVHETLGRC